MTQSNPPHQISIHVNPHPTKLEMSAPQVIQEQIQATAADLAGLLRRLGDRIEICEGHLNGEGAALRLEVARLREVRDNVNGKFKIFIVSVERSRS